MTFKPRALIQFMLILAVFSGMRGGRYFLANRIQEVGFLFCIILLVYGAYMAALRVKREDMNWNTWILGTLFFIAYTMVLPGQLFAMHNGVSALYSILASREFIAITIAPALYFLYKIGFRLKDIESVLIWGLAIITISYIIFSVTLPLESWYFSSSLWKSALVSNDFRGFRLQAPVTGIQLSFFLFGFKAVTEKKNRGLWIFLFACAVIAIFQYKSRSLYVALAISVMFFLVMIRKKSHAPVFLMFLPAIVAGLGYMGMQFFELLEVQAAKGQDVRLAAFNIAIDSIKVYPFFGMGMSNFSLTDNQIFNSLHFFPVDIGIVGIAYRYGLVGATIYIGGVLYLFFSTLGTHFRMTSLGIKMDAFLFTFLCRLFGDIFKYILSVDYTWGHGLTFAAFVIVFNVIHREEMDKFEKSKRAALSAQPSFQRINSR